jgi:branched-subunit amino acid transport protein
MSYWPVIWGMGLITFAIRVSLIALFGRTDIPPGVRRSLRFVPLAVLMALAAPALVRPEGPIDLTLTNTHLLAGILAVLIAWKTHNTLLTISTGMTALWVLTAVWH